MHSGNRPPQNVITSTNFMLSNDKDNLLMELHIYCNDYNFLWKISS